MSASDRWDVVVIGAGPVGETAAQYAVEGGCSAVLVESALLGGECSYWACVPSKALLRPVDLHDNVRSMEGFPAELPPLDVRAVLDRRDYWNSKASDDSGQVEWASGAGIDVIRGRGVLAGEKRVVVDGSRELFATHAVVVATGSYAAVPGPFRDAKPWISRDATNMQEVPERIVIIGGGVVACEAATWLRALGSDVTMVVHGDRLLERDEPWAGALVRAGLEERGVRVLLGASASSVAREDARDTGEGRVHGGPVTVTVEDGTTLEADEILVATGRRPNTEDIGLDTVGLSPGEYIEVDDHMTATGVDGGWLYATGDVNGRALLTHQGKYQARICGDAIAARARGEEPVHRASADHGAVPQVTFTDPQVGSVGLTEAEAREQYGSVGTVEYDLAGISGAKLSRNGYEGRASLVVDTSSMTLLGATFAGPDCGELVHGATIALVGKVPLDVLWHAVPSFPTMSEVWLRLLETWRAEHR